MCVSRLTHLLTHFWAACVLSASAVVLAGEADLVRQVETLPTQMQALTSPAGFCQASPSPSPSSKSTLVGLIVMGGTPGAARQDAKDLSGALSLERSKTIGSFDPSSHSLIQRISSSNVPSWADADTYRMQVAADLLLKGAGSFAGKSGSADQDSRNAVAWAARSIGELQSAGLIQGREDAKDLIATMMAGLYRNYNDPLNPGVAGGDSELRGLARIGSGYQQAVNSGVEDSNNDGGVCDHIAAAGCAVWNKMYPDSPCMLVNIPGPGSQHFYTAISNGDGTITLMDAGYRQDIRAEGNAIASPGNPQLFVPVAKVDDVGNATIVQTAPSELMNFINAVSRPDDPEGQLFRGLAQAGYQSFNYGRKNGRNVVSVGVGRGRLSRQNLGQEVWGVYANLDQYRKHFENKLTVFYSHVGDTPQGVREVAGATVSPAAVWAIPIVPAVKIDLKAGASITLAVMSPGASQIGNEGLGITGGGKLFAQAGINGTRQLDGKTKLQTSLLFRTEGMPGVVITRMHGIDNGGGLGGGIQGFHSTNTLQGSVGLQKSSNAGPYGVGMHGGISKGPLAMHNRPDWNLGTDLNYRKYLLSADYQERNTFFDQGKLVRVELGAQFTRRKTVIEPSLIGQFADYGQGWQSFMGAGIKINFTGPRRPAGH